MNYFLIQLQFNTPVHFGSSESALSLYNSQSFFRADTFFSALCHTALQLTGPQGLEQLVHFAKTNQLFFTDAMPWKGEDFFLPKPMIPPKALPELPAQKRKVLKRLNWLPAASFDDYCKALQAGLYFDIQEVSFGVSTETTRAGVPDNKDALPYPVSTFHFFENSGLYVLWACEEMEVHDWILNLTTGLGISGIGGKVTSGLGKFSILDTIYLNEYFDSQTQWLYESLTRESKSYMLLTTSLPVDGELNKALEGGYYQLIRRAGFVASNSYTTSSYKKQVQYFLDRGAVLSAQFSGDVYDVGPSKIHPVYRYAKPMFLGVKP